MYFQENYQLFKIKHFLNLHARKLFFHAHIQSIIDYRSTLWNSASANTLKPLVSLHKRALKAFLLENKFKIKTLKTNTTLAISDCNFLSILPLKGVLIHNKGLLIHNKGVPIQTLCPEKFHPLFGLSFPKTSHDISENSIYQSLGLTFSSLA